MGRRTPRGNLTSDGARSFTYDLENRLVSVSAAMSLDYDPLGRLARSVGAAGATIYVYDGDRLTEEYDGAGALLRRYAHGVGVDEPLVWYEGGGLGDRRFLHADHQGSVIAASDGAGAIAGAPFAYSAYGEPQGDDWSGARFRYTGQIALPEVKLYHYKARVYDPKLGRFLQTDPIGYEDQWNLYAYVGNDPVNATDPTGQTTAAPLALCAGGPVPCAVGVTITTVLTVAVGVAGLVAMNENADKPEAHAPRPLTDEEREKTKGAGSAPGRGGRTEEGRSIQKHSGRPGNPFPESDGNPNADNEKGAQATGEIVDNPDSTVAVNGRGETIIRAPDGRGIKLRPDGTFHGFREPPKPPDQR